MKARIPIIFWPTVVRWNLSVEGKAIMGKRWCQSKRKEARTIEIWEKAFGQTSKNPLVRSIAFGGAKPEWVETPEDFITQMVLNGESTALMDGVKK